ncbi:outer membrane protein assembly factor BamB family protein [Bacillus sp. AK128]
MSRKNGIYILLSCLFITGCQSSPSVLNEIKMANHSYSEVNPTSKSPLKAEWVPFVDVANQDLSTLTYELTGDLILDPLQSFPEVYTEVEGVLTFRGNHTRTAPSYGNIPARPTTIEKAWEFQTSASPNWGGGAGWTGQPSIIKWEDEIKQIMNIKDEFKQKENFVEVIYGSLDGHIYFFDLETGVESREPININNPIKGSVSIDSRGFPLLYVGQGIPETGQQKIGYRIYSLLDHSLLHFIKGADGYSFRAWGAFDGAPLINRDTDTMVLGGENGLFYTVKLNTSFDQEAQHISIHPETMKYRYKIKGNHYQGIENSVAAYKNLVYFSDNGGSIQAIDLRSMQPVWALGPTDDTDASLVVEEMDEIPVLYTGTQVDKQGTTGNSILRKLNGLTGELLWQKNIPALSQLGDHPVNGGLLATPVIGEHEISDLVIYTIARYKTMAGGLMIALDKQTGEEIWSWEMPNYAWSSPVPVYTEEGEAFMIQCDSIGNISVLNGTTGEIIANYPFNSNMEASPAIYQNMMVVANRGGQIGAFYIK